MILLHTKRHSHSLKNRANNRDALISRKSSLQKKTIKTWLLPPEDKVSGTELLIKRSPNWIKIGLQFYRMMESHNVMKESSLQSRASMLLEYSTTNTSPLRTNIKFCVYSSVLLVNKLKHHLHQLLLVCNMRRLKTLLLQIVSCVISVMTVKDKNKGCFKLQMCTTYHGHLLPIVILDPPRARLCTLQQGKKERRHFVALCMIRLRFVSISGVHIIMCYGLERV